MSVQYTCLDYALALWRCGLSIIPVPRPGAEGRRGEVLDGKTPVIAWKAYQRERATEARLRHWFADNNINIAVITGPLSGVVVVDTDSDQAEAWARLRLPRTPWRVQTAKGWHRYYGHPGVRVPTFSKIATSHGRLALDVRGDGGFVIGPGSLHASGASYEAKGDWSVPVAKLPRFWLGWLQRAKPQPTSRHSVVPVRPHGDVVVRARAYLAAIPRPVIGEGSDDATFRAACRLVRGFQLEPAMAVELLMEWSGFDRDWIEAKVASASKYGTERPGGLLEVPQ